MTILLMEGFDLYPGTDAPIGLAANWQISMSYASITIACRAVWRALFERSGAGPPILPDLPDPVGSDRGLQLWLAVQISDSRIAVCLAARSDRAYQFCLRTDSLGNLIACRASAGNAQTDLGRTGPRFCTPTHGTISRSKA
jgi:hypothetical protein